MEKLAVMKNTAGDLARAPDMAPATPRDVFNRFMGKRDPKTKAMYQRRWRFFADHLKLDGPETALAFMTQAGRGQAHAAAEGFVSEMVQDGKSSAVVNQSVAALRSMLKIARQVGMMEWSLELEGVKHEARRSTRGPGLEGCGKILAHIEATYTGANRRRNVALFRLLWDLALRRNEIISLDLEHVHLSDVPGRLAVLRKGKRERELIDLDPKTGKALAAWIKSRGDWAGPLFTSYADGHRRQRLTGGGLHYLIKNWGRACGLRLWPHAIRHSALTHALRSAAAHDVAKLSGHRSLDILVNHYDDSGSEIARKVTAGLAAAL